MFVRTKSTPNSPRKSVQIVESVRDGHRVRQRIVRHVGVAMDDKELEGLLELAQHIKSQIQEEHTPTLFGPEKMAKLALQASKTKQEDEDPINVSLRSLREEQRIIVGIHEIYGKLYRQLGFDQVLKPSRHGQSASDILRHIVMARIANPESKRSSVINLEADFGVNLNLQNVYRMMDKLDEEACEKIQACAYQTVAELFGGKIDLIFFDATTLYFESFTEDELKQNGFSKDHKFGQPQVLLALMVTEQGMPIGYEAFPGSTYEGHTLIPMLESIKQRYNLGKVVFVADSGLLNAANLQAMDEAGFKYIVGARLRKMKSDIQQKILNTDNYTSHDDHDDKLKLASFELDHDRTLFVSHSSKRARKDAHDRSKAITKINQKLKKSKNPKELISNKGNSKFLKIEGKAEIQLDEEKCAQAAVWDGLHGVITNDSELSAEDALSQYRGLWQVEESFRITKHDLKVRPIYHWTPNRIRAHLAISFMAFTCVRHLEYRVRLQYKKLSPETIRAALTRVQSSILIDPKKQRYVIPSEASHEARKIYQVMGLSYSATPYRLNKDVPSYN
jgi:transposase